MTLKVVLVLACALACALHVFAQSADEICAMRPDVPCLKVPECSVGWASADFYLNSEITPTFASNNATVNVCHEKGGLTVSMTAMGPYTKSISKSCMDNVWEHGAALEVRLHPTTCSTLSIVTLIISSRLTFLPAELHCSCRVP